MLKKIGIGLAVFVLVVAGGVWYLFANLDSYVKSAIEKYGTAAVEAPVGVGRVDLSLTSGEGTISGITVDNPAGYGGGRAVAVGAMTVQIDTSTVTGSGPIVIKLVRVSQPVVNYVVTQGGSNLQTIQHNVQNYAGGGHSNSGPPASSAPARKEIINDLYIDEGEVNATTPLLAGRMLKVPLPSIHLTELGQASGGATAAEIGAQILSAITAKATQAGTKAITSQGGAAAAAAIQGLGVGKIKSLF
jgi:hypothetical protein